MIGMTGITEHLTASHMDPIMDEGLHEHTWAVTAYFRSAPLRDGRPLKAALRTILDHLPEAGVLPPPLWSGEAIAVTVARLMPGDCIGCRVTRPVEGYEAWAWFI